MPFHPYGHDGYFSRRWERIQEHSRHIHLWKISEQVSGLRVEEMIPGDSHGR
jgi:hypothetical protein